MHQDNKPRTDKPAVNDLSFSDGLTLSQLNMIHSMFLPSWPAIPHLGEMELPKREIHLEPVMQKPKIVVLGSGFGAAGLLKNIDRAAYDVTLVSPRNHFLFTPLLASTAVGTLELRSITEPVRDLLQADDTYYRAKAERIDRQRQVVVCTPLEEGPSFEVPYDKLVVSVGAVTNSFGIPGVKDHCLFLKDGVDSVAIRAKVIDLFERASLDSTPPQEKSRLLQFVIIGGGPTGVEFAGELSDFVRREAERSYPHLKEYVRLCLLEAGPTILTAYNTSLRDHAILSLRRNGVDVRMGVPVVGVQPDVLNLKDGSSFPYGMAVWSSGIKPNDVVNQLGLPLDARGRIAVDKRLKVSGADEIYALGDCAGVDSENLAPTAQVASQQGKYLGNALNAAGRGEIPVEFHFKDQGRLAYVGGGDAIADLPFAKIKGFPAWVFWRSVYLTKLSSFRSQVQVCFDWVKGALFGRDTSQF
jgi:NADH:ubiquinone reductase (non-electrogenic)